MMRSHRMGRQGWRRWSCLILYACLASGPVGCQSAHIPNPNDPADVGPLSPDTIRRNLKAATDALTERLATGEIDDKRYRALVERAAEEIAAQADPSSIKPAEAWEYGEILKDAHLWRLAEPELRTAVGYAISTKNEDRRVNDSLRLATVLAQEGKVPEAIKTARSVYDAPPEGTAPILLATYLEIVPAAQGKGYDAELARLVEDAIPIHMRTMVDANTLEGKEFLYARPHHVRNAWLTAAALYDRAGRKDLGKRAREKCEEQNPSFTANENIALARIS